MPSVLFVCSANMCRSPMAEVLFKAKLGQEGEADEWRVESAGTWAQAGRSATAFAQAVMAERGLDLSGHRSQPTSRSLVDGFDLILVMEEAHGRSLRHDFPDLAHRVYLLTEMIGGSEEIADPVSGGIEDYRKTADSLSRSLERGYVRIRSLARQKAGRGAQG